MRNPYFLPEAFTIATVTSGVTLGLATLSSAATVIDTTPDWDGTQPIGPFGETLTPTYGQTIVVPAVDNVLDSFSFILGPDITNGTAPVTFAGYVAAWDGTKATGSLLYTSGTQTYSGGGFETFTFNTGGISLVSGQDYVLFLSASNFFDGGTHRTNMASISPSTSYADGNFVFFNNGSDFGQLFTNDWQAQTLRDTAFTASFSDGVTESVPEPSRVIALVVLGGSLLLGKKRG